MVNISAFLKKHKLSLDDSKGDKLDSGATGWQTNTPFIMSGDFNSVPDDSVFHLIYDKKFPVDQRTGRANVKLENGQVNKKSAAHPAYVHK